MTADIKVSDVLFIPGIKAFPTSSPLKFISIKTLNNKYYFYSKHKEFLWVHAIFQLSVAPNKQPEWNFFFLSHIWSFWLRFALWHLDSQLVWVKMVCSSWWNCCGCLDPPGNKGWGPRSCWHWPKAWSPCKPRWRTPTNYSWPDEHIRLSHTQLSKTQEVFV